MSARWRFTTHEQRIGEVRCYLARDFVLVGTAPSALDPDAGKIALRSLVAELRRTADEIEAFLAKDVP